MRPWICCLAIFIFSCPSLLALELKSQVPELFGQNLTEARKFLNCPTKEQEDVFFELMSYVKDNKLQQKLFTAFLGHLTKYDFASLEKINNQYNLFKDNKDMIRCKNEKNINMLMYAVINNNIGLIKDLLNNNIDVNLTDNYGQTVLDYSIYYSKNDLLTEIILKKNPDVNKVKFLTMLELCSQLMRGKRIIIDKKAVKNMFYNRLLCRHLSSKIVQKSRVNDLDKFLEIGFNPYTKDKDNKSYIDRIIVSNIRKTKKIIDFYENKLEKEFYQKIRNIDCELDINVMSNMVFLPEIWFNIILFTEYNIKEYLKLITVCKGWYISRANINIIKYILKNTDDELRYYFMQVSRLM